MILSTDDVVNPSAVLAHIILRERLHTFGILGCALCVVGSITIVLHAPQERQIESVIEVWDLATEPGNFLFHRVSDFSCFIFFNLIQGLKHLLTHLQLFSSMPLW